MKRLTIGIDFDDVLFEFNNGFLQYFNKLHGTGFVREQVTDYQLHLLLGGTKEDIHDLIDEFYSSENHAFVSPVLGAVEALHALKDHNLVLISARPEHTRTATEKWLSEHFPGLFKNVHLTGLYRGKTKDTKSKEEIARECGVDVFIEDSLSHAIKITATGIPVILIDTPWNQAETPDGATRVFTWKEILTLLQERAGH
jgi:uncharacterized HAD superfamily protein